MFFRKQRNKKCDLKIQIDGSEIDQVDRTKFLGFVIDQIKIGKSMFLLFQEKFPGV